ncbi:MAG TPA: YkgJ family cysteine cluster protein [Sphaerochaeta sp.]|nr:YkgJ family cysteine cluster protein [Sphaerochaeta sp.]
MGCFYERGLEFTCIDGCSYCCGVEPGYVFLTQDDLTRLCEQTHLTEEAFISTYCYPVDMGQFYMISLLEQENYDCIFLKGGRCSVYEARPLQCRTYPFWPAIMESAATWKQEAASCPGIGKGKRFKKKEIDTLLSLQRGRVPLMIAKEG